MGSETLGARVRGMRFAGHADNLWPLTYRKESARGGVKNIVYIEGDDEGFYTLEPNGEVTPYR
jgi:hypothetical protein